MFQWCQQESGDIVVSCLYILFHYFSFLRASELADSLTVPLESIPQMAHSPILVREFASYSYGKSLFDRGEFRRAAHTLKDCQSIEAVSLRLYSLYLVSLRNVLRIEVNGFFLILQAGEKSKQDEQVECFGGTCSLCVCVCVWLRY